jgi:hypothetical protein
MYTFDYVTMRSYPQAMQNLSCNPSFILSFSNGAETVQCDGGAMPASDHEREIGWRYKGGRVECSLTCPRTASLV